MRFRIAPLRCPLLHRLNMSTLNFMGSLIIRYLIAQYVVYGYLFP